jgi:hypothetical protein
MITDDLKLVGHPHPDMDRRKFQTWIGGTPVAVLCCLSTAAAAAAVP